MLRAPRARATGRDAARRSGRSIAPGAAGSGALPRSGCVISARKPRATYCSVSSSSAGVKIGPNGTPLACAVFWISARVLSANHGAMICVELGDVLAAAGAGGELLVLQPRIADQGARRRPLRDGVDDGDVAVAAGHDLELRGLAFAAGRGAGGGRARRRLPVHPLHHLGERHADMRRALSGLARGERGGEAGEGGQARGIGGLMAAELQRLARGLADHVHQAAQRLDRELADRSRCGIHFHRKGRDLDRRRLARAGERRDRCRLLEQAGVGCGRAVARDLRGRPRSRGRAPASAWTY